MTAACGGGTSGPRSGINSPFVVDPGTALNILSFAGGIGWSLFVGAIDTFLWDPVSSCTTDPPGFQTLTLAETMALVPMNSGSPDFLSAISKLKDNIQTALWYANCQCVSAPQPAQPPIPPLPSGTPQSAADANGSCSDLAWQGTPPLVTQTAFPQGDLDASGVLLPFPGTPISVPVIGGARGNTPLYLMPLLKPTSARVLLKVPSGNTHVQSVSFWVGNTTCANTVGPLSIDVNPTTKFSFDTGIVTLPTTNNCSGTSLPITHYAVTIDTITDFGDHLTGPATVEVQLYGCNPIGPQCCDQTNSQPNVNVDTTALSNAIAELNTLVTLIQRQAVPFAYNLSTVHPGLTGSGQISVADILGAKVIPASIPPSAGLEVGDPDSLWLDSWIRWGNADGWQQREFLTAAPFISMPQYAGQWTRLGYTLRAGLSVDITELVREP